MAIKFEVKGEGGFPFDMLRRDRCFPTTEFEACKLGLLEPRTVELISPDANLPPTFDRWRSFGWRVVSVDGSPLAEAQAAIDDAREAFDDPALLVNILKE